MYVCVSVYLYVCVLKPVNIMCVCVCVCICRSLRCPLNGISACFHKGNVFGGGSRWVWSTSILGQLWSYLAGDHRMGDVETGVS